MSQSQVLEFLKRNQGKWFTSSQIAKGLNIHPNSITANLSKLRKTRWIEFNGRGLSNKPYLYKYRN